LATLHQKNEAGCSVEHPASADLRSIAVFSRSERIRIPTTSPIGGRRLIGPAMLMNRDHGTLEPSLCNTRRK